MKPSFDKNIAYNKSDKTIKNNKTKNRSSAHNNKSENQNNVSNPINNNGQIISGYFINEKSYKEIIIQRVNNFLCGILGILVLFCLVCYYFVSCKEVQLNKISRETLELNYENEELQNKVDTLQSYYNIDKAVSKTNILERAKQVIEVNAIDMPNYNFKKTKKSNNAIVVSY